MRDHRLTAALAAFVVLGVGAGCSSSPPTSDRAGSIVNPNPSSTKTGTGEVRHDLEPLTKRFAALDAPVSATWMSGTLAGHAPGPTTYWIDAVVELSPDAAAGLRAKATTDLPSPAVEAAVAAAVPAGALRGGPALDAAFAQGGFRAKAYLVEGTDTIVLEALGQ